ncbi:MAG: carboxylating nicotinate-nucleotide diphosphorylase [Methylovulum sp.]|jgi:nicotinate-nucleotide pyrophosphorylase (carboxylating)|nr:carboxylating nicotinate-nucleotide diphosphorylase [Methylovulum sp.]
MTASIDTALIQLFLEEDIRSGDITAGIIPEQCLATAEVINRERMVMCGQAWFDEVFNCVASSITITWLVNEGEMIEANTVLCRVHGAARALLSAERTALNLLQTLTATATIARKYADAVAQTECKVLDTRKTLPGLRLAQKYAVRCGGCYNHRLGLDDGVLIKENHIMAAGSISQAIILARSLTALPIEIEVENLAQFYEALHEQPERIMLDNFTFNELQTAVQLKKAQPEYAHIELEASGNITLANIRTIALTGVDFISIGALTKNVMATDLSMRITLIT